MRQEKNNRKQKKYKHLNDKVRYKLEVLLERKVKVSEISDLLGKHKSTIYREIKRGKIRRTTSELKEIEAYRANVAQRRCDEEKSNRERELKIGKDHKLAEYIRKEIVEKKNSPYVLIVNLNKQREIKTRISVKTVYNYVDRGLIYGVTNESLWEKRKRKRKPRKKIVRIATKNRLGKNISERPLCADLRQTYGHWEIDTVRPGKNKGKAVLITLTERLTRESKVLKIPKATVKNVDKALTKLEKEYKDKFSDIFKSITADNGGEFLNWSLLEASKLFKGNKRTTFYFANPYSAWQRGSNENQNRMIRRFIPKGSNISKISNKTIKDIENWINNYPRKILGGKSANEFLKELHNTSF